MLMVMRVLPESPAIPAIVTRGKMPVMKLLSYDLGIPAANYLSPSVGISRKLPPKYE
jgi:hypothetical protein